MVKPLEKAEFTEPPPGCYTRSESEETSGFRDISWDFHPVIFLSFSEWRMDGAGQILFQETHRFSFPVGRDRLVMYLMEKIVGNSTS